MSAHQMDMKPVPHLCDLMHQLLLLSEEAGLQGLDIDQQDFVWPVMDMT